MRKLQTSTAYLVRALAAELQLSEQSLAAKREELQKLVQTEGFDLEKHAFVLHPGNEYPVGTVIDKATGKPLVDEADADDGLSTLPAPSAGAGKKATKRG